ncbi:threonine synthase [Paenibacillus sp.]|uniref:threonine synthase n=1 Tax=Paenibacillus sp. TaxID=58172 RepID=UPI002D43F7AB|nr:threonine synthase [Paenibacillus sp.]HZG85383.1 threonine synthase [Paenibacillus sp.]
MHEVPELECTACGMRRVGEWSDALCGCGADLWDIRRPTAQLDGERLKRLFDDRLALRSGPYSSGVWRYRELIAPEFPEDALVYRGEGNTGLYESERLAAFAGVRKLWLKAQSENPSGSFKDNGMAVAVTHGKLSGSTRFVCSSTGNTSASLAMYAAWAGLDAFVLAPAEGVSRTKVIQTLAYGACVIPFDGTYDDGIRFLREHARRLGLYVCNSVNPYRIEGQKSIAFELAQQLGWRTPDWIALPGGALSNVSALGEALEQLHALGMIDAIPRIALVQAEGASPFHAMLRDGAETLTPEPRPHTRASALNIGNPPSWRRALRALRVSNGLTVAVSDREIMEAKRVIDREGIGCEPASAATLAGVLRLRAAGRIAKDQTAACILTGHLLKDIEALEELHLTELSSGPLEAERLFM